LNTCKKFNNVLRFYGDFVNPFKSELTSTSSCWKRLWWSHSDTKP